MDKIYDAKIYEKRKFGSALYDERETIRGLNLPQADAIKLMMDRLGIKCRVIEYQTGGK